jgi:hypothetical protein
MNAISSSAARLLALTADNIAKTSMADLIAIHNSVAPKAVKKFSDRKTAERRLLSLAAETRAAASKGDKAAKKAGDLRATDRRTATRRDAPAAPKVKKAAKPAADRSSAIAASWSNAEVANARSMRHSVKVGGETYKSVATAFRALNLPMGPHIRVRMEIVANGKAVHQNHKFTLVKGE